MTEAKVTTANYDAEFGATAGVISAQTKSGTNNLHGALSYFLRNDVFNARNPFTQFQKIPGTDSYIPVTQWNQFGGALGGPLARNKLFFFGDYQGTRRNTGGSALLRVPSAVEREGISVSLASTSSTRRPAQPPRTGRSSRATVFRCRGYHLKH